MKKLVLMWCVLLLGISSPAYGQCFRLTGCDGWVEDTPIFASRVSGTDALLVAILPDNVSHVIVFWGDRNKTEASVPLPVVFAHTYDSTLNWFKLRVKVLTPDGYINYTRDPALFIETTDE